MSEKARRSYADLKFNGVSVTVDLKNQLEKISYTDVADGESDSVELTVQNIGLKWMTSWRPAFGDTISGSMNYEHWYNAKTKPLKVDLGTLCIDSIKYDGQRGGTATIGALSIPANTAWKTQIRTKTWENATLQQIGQEIAGRYGMSLTYEADTVSIASVEQTQETDSEFLYKQCQDHNLAMKVFQKKIIIYDKGTWEAKAAITTIDIKDFESDWTINDTIQGIYTGARVAYKPAKAKKEMSVFVGFVGESDPHARNLKVTETCDSEADARKKGIAAVNAANEQATTLSGSIFPDPRIVAGVCVTLSGFGKNYDGKWFVDKSKQTISGSDGATQDIELHKVQKRL